MSVQIQAKLICNTCGRVVAGKLQTKRGWRLETYDTAKREAFRLGWLVEAQGRYPDHHYCPACADRAPR